LFSVKRRRRCAWYYPDSPVEPPDFSSLKSCLDLRDVHIVAAVRSSEAMAMLLERFTEIAAPGKGAPILLAALARMGTMACDWIDGELRIDVSSEAAGERKRTRIAISTTLGGGFREKLFADTILDVPIEEFARGIKRAPRLVEPLTVRETDRRIVLSVTAAVRKTSLPPPAIELDPSSFVSLPRATMPYQAPMPLPEITGYPSSSEIPAVRPAAPPPAKPDSGAPPPERKVVLRRRVRSDDPKR